MDLKRIRVGLFAFVGALMTLLAMADGHTLVGGVTAAGSIASWTAALCFAVDAARRK